MKTSLSRWAIAAAVILTVGWVAQAQAGDDDNTYRWAIGWDDGVGMRHMLSDNWGIGLQFKPDISSQDVTNAYKSGGNAYQTTGENNTSQKNWSAGIMLFRQMMLTKNIGIGPYGRIAYARESVEQTSSSTTVETRSLSHYGNMYTVEIGIRPTFTFQKRFVLESRFGFGVREWDRTVEDFHDVGTDSRQENNETEFFALGKDLGPGAVMQFMIYF